MKTITRQKPFEEVQRALERENGVYVIGCGTCATMCHTGGKAEVMAMKQTLEKLGKIVTGWMVIPTVCNDLTSDALRQEAKNVQQATAILVMSCAFGVQMVSNYSDRHVYPALDTLFIGLEVSPGSFTEACKQCGECILSWTGGICPVVSCHKGLVNGPCGGTNNGKCEVDPEKDCAWTLIYNRLAKEGRLDRMRLYQPPKNFNAVVRPGRAAVK